MHRSESYDRSRCLNCGAEVSGTRDRAYTLGPEDVLCFKCATERGGSYDAGQDRWVRAPRLEGLSLSERWDEGRVWR